MFIFPIFSTLALWSVMRQKFIFGKIYGGGINLYVHNFQDFSKSPQLKTYLFQLFWEVIPLLEIFFFHHNPTDLEIEDLKRLMTFLSRVHLSPFVLDEKAWIPSSLGVFLVKSFFLALTNVSDSIPFHLAKFLWKSRAPSKVMAFAWLVAFKKVNTNDMLQLRRSFKAHSLD